MYLGCIELTAWNHIYIHNTHAPYLHVCVSHTYNTYRCIQVRRKFLVLSSFAVVQVDVCPPTKPLHALEE